MEKISLNKTPSFIFILLFALMFAYISLAGPINVYSQPTMPSMGNATMAQQHAEHILDNLITSEHIPLSGQLVSGDYVLLMDLTPFATSIEGHSHIALKIPCNSNGTPMVTLVTGVLGNLNSLDIGSPIKNGTLNGKNLELSAEGKSCLYHAELPNGTSDIALANTSNKTMSFGDVGYYSVTLTIHGTAIQHLASNQTQK